MHFTEEEQRGRSSQGSNRPLVVQGRVLVDLVGCLKEARQIARDHVQVLVRVRHVEHVLALYLEFRPEQNANGTQRGSRFTRSALNPHARCRRTGLHRRGSGLRSPESSLSPGVS